MIDRMIWRSGRTLALVAALCAAIVALTWQLTHERIESNRKAYLERSLEPALAGVFFDSGVSESILRMPAPHALPGNETALIYRVYAAEEPVAALFVVSARDGYAGPIRLLIGVSMDGTITGVRVLEHRETPGLGDRIELTKSDWILQFDGRSLRQPDDSAWKIKRDGGEFDQLSGASVTPRAIVKAVRATLKYFDENRDDVFKAPESVTNTQNQSGGQDE